MLEGLLSLLNYQIGSLDLDPDNSEAKEVLVDAFKKAMTDVEEEPAE